MAVQLHQLAAVMQYVVFGIAAALALFFLVQIRKRRTNWEVLFAMVALATLYMLERQWGPAGPADISMTRSGRRLPWFRYAEWFLTFPSLLIAVANLTGLGRRKWGQGMALLGAFQVALLGGVTAAYCSGLAAKIVFACIAAAAYAVVLVLTSVTFGLTYREVPQSLHGFVSLLCVLLLLTWLAYPVVWALGPEGFHRISFDGETVAFAFADIFAKCAWSFLLWYFRRTFRAAVPAQYWAAQADARATPGALRYAGISQQPLLKDSPVFTPGRRFQPAVAEVEDGSGAGKAPLVSEEVEELPMTGWPLGLARSQDNVAPRDATRPRAVPRFWFPGLSDQIRTEQAASSPTGTPFPVTRGPLLAPSPRQELDSGAGVTIFQNPLALTDSEARAAGDASGSGRELAIDIPGEGLGVSEANAPAWGGAASSEDRKRTWATFVRSFGGLASPPKENPEEEELESKTLKRSSIAGLYFGAPQKTLGEESPVSVLPAETDSTTPGSGFMTPGTRLEGISEGSEGSGFDVLPSASKESPPPLTSPSTALVERRTPRIAPRRRPLPFSDSETGELSRGPIEEGSPVPDVMEGLSELPTGSRRTQTMGEGDSDLDSFDSVGSGLEESDSGGSAEGLDPGLVEPKFRVFSGRLNLSKPNAGSPPIDSSRALVVFSAERVPRQLVFETPRVATSLELVEGIPSVSPSKGSPRSASPAAFDDEPKNFLLARPARRRFGESDPLSPRVRALLAREVPEGLSAAASSPRGSGGNAGGSPPGRTGIVRSASAESLTRRAENPAGGGISVSFDPPQRRSGGAFAYWSGGIPVQMRSSGSEKDLSDYWGSVTGTPTSIRSPEAEPVQNSDIRRETETYAGAPEAVGGRLDTVGAATTPADAIFRGGDVRLQRYGSSDVSFVSAVSIAQSDSGGPGFRRRSFDSTELTWRLDDFRRRSFPVPQSRDRRSATEDLGALLPSARRARPRPALTSGPAPDAWEEEERPETERGPGGIETQGGRDSRALHPQAQGGGETSSGTGTSVESGAVEQRVAGLGPEELGGSPGGRTRRPSPYYHYSGDPVTVPPVNTGLGGLEPIVEMQTPEMSPESGGMGHRTAIRFYSPHFRQS